MTKQTKDSFATFVNSGWTKIVVCLAFTAGTSWAVIGGKLDSLTEVVTKIGINLEDNSIRIRKIEDEQLINKMFRQSNERYSKSEALVDQTLLRKEFTEKLGGITDTLSTEIKNSQLETKKVIEKLSNKIDNR